MQLSTYATFPKSDAMSLTKPGSDRSHTYVYHYNSLEVGNWLPQKLVQQLQKVENWTLPRTLRHS